MPGFVKVREYEPANVHGVENPSGPRTSVTSCWRVPMKFHVNVVPRLIETRSYW